MRKDINGLEVKVGDIVHCYDQESDGEITQSLRGMVNEVNGKILVGDNDLAIGCAQHVKVINPDEYAVKVDI